MRNQGMKMRPITRMILVSFLFLSLWACGPTGEVVRVTTVAEADLKGIGEENLAQLAEIKAAKKMEKKDDAISQFIEGTPSYTVQQYLALNPDADNASAQNYRVGGYDVIDITVYEEADLSRKDVGISADGYISFPLLGRMKVDGLSTSDIEKLISVKLAQGQYLLDAHVSVTVSDYKSKQFMVLGAVAEPGTFPLQGKERLLDAISRAGGVSHEKVGK